MDQENIWIKKKYGLRKKLINKKTMYEILMKNVGVKKI